MERVYDIVQGYVDRQGHDRCWYLPELFDALAKELDISARHPAELPSIEEFCRGCAKYQATQYPTKSNSDEWR